MFAIVVCEFKIVKEFVDSYRYLLTEIWRQVILSHMDR